MGGPSGPSKLDDLVGSGKSDTDDGYLQGDLPKERIESLKRLKRQVACAPLVLTHWGLVTAYSKAQDVLPEPMRLNLADLGYLWCIHLERHLPWLDMDCWNLPWTDGKMDSVTC